MFGRSVQRTLGLGLIVATLALIASSARCEEAPRKPSVCLSFELGQVGSAKVAMCRDGKRPVVFPRYAIVEVDGVRYLLGWR